ncbi:MAG: hypothetical protein IPP94_01445 [Ignavibacteria bacterium]|nr:hypothetical protein [Ignavibacteria bacterium]
MKIPKDLPELWDRTPEERERLWKLAERAGWTRFRMEILIAVFALSAYLLGRMDFALPFPAGWFSMTVSEILSALAFGAMLFALHRLFHRLHRNLVRKRLREDLKRS